MSYLKGSHQPGSVQSTSKQDHLPAYEDDVISPLIVSTQHYPPKPHRRPLYNGSADTKVDEPPTAHKQSDTPHTADISD